MESTNRFQTFTWRVAAAALAALAVSACTVTEQEAPTLAGPSGFALSLTVSAAPQIIPRDGSSMSTISIVARDANGAPRTNQRLMVQASAGSLSASEVNTDGNGAATLLFVAPGLNDRVSSVTVSVIPVENGDLANSNSRSVRIGLAGPDIPLADFTFDPEDAAVQDIVAFDASVTTLGGSPCGGACDYSWDFGDGSSATGVGAGHAFANAGVFNVTLTVTSKANGTTATVTKPVKIAVPPAPEAAFTFSPSSPAAGQNIIFSSTSVLAPGVTIVRHVWDLDNGSPPVDTGSTPSYTLTGGYGATSSHQVTLTITDNFGRTSRSDPETVDIP
jgi:PKD repeat protein